MSMAITSMRAKVLPMSMPMIMKMGVRTMVLVAVLMVRSTVSENVSTVSGNASTGAEYVRPIRSEDLRLDDLKRPEAPHHPEQVHLALAGPGRVAVSWVTWPWVRIAPNIPLANIRHVVHHLWANAHIKACKRSTSLPFDCKLLRTWP